MPTSRKHRSNGKVVYVPKGEGSGTAGGNNITVADRALNKLNAPINAEKAGTNYRSLPQAFKNNIDKNLTPTQNFQDAVKNGNPNNMTDEWSAGLRGVKEKRTVITSYKDGKIEYTVKQKNKILFRTDSKERVANQIAQFYNKYI